MDTERSIDRSTELRAQPPTAAAGANDGAPEAASDYGSLNAAIANAVVHTYKDYLGRGPTKARSSIRDDVVVVLLEDTMTKAEKTLVAQGEADATIQMRRTIQRTMRSDLSDLVADLTGRRVLAFMSDQHPDPDYAVEVFVLEDRP